MSVLPLLLIPQLLLSGFLKPMSDVYINARNGKPATAEQYEAFEARRQSPSMAAGRLFASDPISKISGLGAGSYAADVTMARWSVDALVHGVSEVDVSTRERLAAQLFVEAYGRVWDGADESSVRDAFVKRVWLDWTVLIAETCLCLLLAAFALRAKDSL